MRSFNFTVFAVLIVAIAARALVTSFPNVALRELPHGYNKSLNANRIPIASGPALAPLDFDINNYAPQDMWEKFLRKGEHLTCLMRATDAGAGFLMQDTRTPPSAASKWSGGLQAELATWGWRERFDLPQDNCEFMEFEKTLDALMLPFEPNEGNVCHEINHWDPQAYFTNDKGEWFPISVRQQPYYVNGKRYESTKASYQFATNSEDGAIFAQDILSPKHSAKSPYTWSGRLLDDELPDLRYASDIMFGVYTRNNPDVKRLRIYMGQTVINDETILLLSRAVRNKYGPKTTLTDWPGHSFSADSDEGKALIASPIGAIAANMLIRHKAELGIKHITEVTCVTADILGGGVPSWQDVNLFFAIEDVPGEEVEPGPSGSTEKGVVSDSKVLQRRSEGRDILRAHTFRL